MQNPVKTAALAHGLRIEQPERWDADTQAALAALRCDLAAVVAYGLLLPEAALAIPRLGCVNLHLSLLPRWRGAAPVARAIEAGDRTTGVSLMQLAPALDTGPVVARCNCPIEARDTTAALGERLARLGAKMLTPFLDDAERLLAAAEPQDEEAACYAHKLRKDEADVDWRRPAVEIERRVRALNPWPVAQTRAGNMTLRIWESEVHAGEKSATDRPGRVTVAGHSLLVHCGEGVLEIKQLQTPGKNVMPARDFLNGHDVDGKVFG